MLRVARIQGADHLGVVPARRPGDPQAAGARPHPREILVAGWRHRAQDPNASVEHDPRRRHPGHQRQLRVPLLDRHRGPIDQRDAAASVLADLLRGAGQVDRPARDLLGLPALADLAQQGDLRMRQPHRRAAPARRRRRACARLRTAARCSDTKVARPSSATSKVHTYAPRTTSGQQAGGGVGQDRRMQRDLQVRAVDRLAAPAGLCVQRAAERRRRRAHRRSRSAPGTPRRPPWPRCGRPGPGPSSLPGPA